MNKAESAELILKLYDLRREEKMRAGRDWMVSFVPNSVEEILGVVVNPETGPKLRMVISYWDMAATLVNHGAIDAEMFNESNGEHVMVFSKIEPHLEGLRAAFSNQKFLLNLEKLVMGLPDAKELLENRRQMIKRMIDARAQMAQTA